MPATHPCVMPANGDCEEFCFSAINPNTVNLAYQYQSATRICGCGYGKKIAKDQQKCVTDPDATPLPGCRDGGQERSILL